MLQKLYIKNYAIIDELEIQFHPHFTVLTGETGAGKSIILGALSLILGERADTSILIDKDSKCIIEAVFSTAGNESVTSFLQHADLDVEAETHIRREINANGKSRAFINDTPANLSQLQELGSQLVDLNRQFDNRLLNQSAFQYEIIDSFSDNRKTLLNFRKSLQEHNEQLATLQVLKEAEIKARAESEYLQFLYDELQEANFVADEIEEIEQKVKLAQHQEEIAQVLSSTYHQLSDADDNQVSQLKKLCQDLQSIMAVHPASATIHERLNSVLEEVKDIAIEVEGMQGAMTFDPGALEIWTERMDIGFRLFKKHNVADTNELIAFQKDLEAKLMGFESLEVEIEKMNTIIDASLRQLTALSQQLFENRSKVVPKIVKELTATLAKIGMSSAQIKITVQATATFNSFGKDEIAFLIDANNSGQFHPISKVASGGELSRLLLAIKSLVSENLSMPTLIFDEVDAAISGEAAKQVSVLMASLSEKHQVIVLTHQAQMAAKGSLHLFIYKDQANKTARIQTKVKILNPSERVGKIAQMIGGLEHGDAAMQSAAALLSIEM